MKLPRMVQVRQHFTGPTVEDIEEEVWKQLSLIGLESKVIPGARIALTAGSRGIANIAKIIKATVAKLKSLGADPFIIPAMGSHGGATAEGQVKVLASLGVTEEYCGAPILSSMEVVQIGETERGIPVYVDRHASEGDGIILIGRVKVHTDFKSPIGIESGIMKMSAIGLGKHKQALAIHNYGVEGIRDFMPEVARVVLQKANILCGLAIVENAYEHTAMIEAIPTDQIEEREREILKFSASLMPKLPVDRLDVLHVDEIGKNFSGTGMDTNIIGRMRILGVEEPASPAIKYVIAGDLSEECGGNALGIGLADLTTRRLFEKIDYVKTNENVITSTFLQRAMIPIILENDREAMSTALRCSWGVNPEQARVMRISSTLHLEHLYVSEALLPEIEALGHVEIVGELEEMQFDADGFFI
ncbi:nickel-dependent lactate racemase [Paenibacillus radicis (ex Xue et al. 2023)]|uniref:Nickel-dependent lactate racemase n=1 Tax=Paenibacillus radicis (ex Xue et al. 2023) TaxID=2972489 RepID=A0ABT1YGH4_9BACL|nr:nickel-dependent lactate racemase [Paenibacillus radicis (ex Xue et al. 2023)]MCR8632291.1 nickel-dependent lactate racemase [Paenibacillus radicis (ex Xue et al. 2023)]